MARNWKLAKGREAFKKFVLDQSAIKARNVELGERDVKLPACHRVSRAEMLDRFLARRPDLEAFRAEFVDVYSELSEFCVDTSRWNVLVPA